MDTLFQIYKMTPEERFRYFNKAGKLPPEPKTKSTQGTLYLDGKMFFGPAAYPLCQHKRAEMIRLGYNKSKLTIKRHD